MLSRVAVVLQVLSNVALKVVHEQRNATQRR